MVAEKKTTPPPSLSTPPNKNSLIAMPIVGIPKDSPCKSCPDDHSLPLSSFHCQASSAAGEGEVHPAAVSARDTAARDAAATAAWDTAARDTAARDTAARNTAARDAAAAAARDTAARDTAALDTTAVPVTFTASASPDPNYAVNQMVLMFTQMMKRDDERAQRDDERARKAREHQKTLETLLLREREALLLRPAPHPSPAPPPLHWSEIPQFDGSVAACRHFSSFWDSVLLSVDSVDGSDIDKFTTLKCLLTGPALRKVDALAPCAPESYATAKKTLLLHYGPDDDPDAFMGPPRAQSSPQTQPAVNGFIHGSLGSDASDASDAAQQAQATPAPPARAALSRGAAAKEAAAHATAVPAAATTPDFSSTQASPGEHAANEEAAREEEESEDSAMAADPAVAPAAQASVDLSAKVAAVSSEVISSGMSKAPSVSLPKNISKPHSGLSGTDSCLTVADSGLSMANSGPSAAHSGSSKPHSGTTAVGLIDSSTVTGSSLSKAASAGLPAAVPVIPSSTVPINKSESKAVPVGLLAAASSEDLNKAISIGFSTASFGLSAAVSDGPSEAASDGLFLKIDSPGVSPVDLASMIVLLGFSAVVTAVATAIVNGQLLCGLHQASDPPLLHPTLPEAPGPPVQYSTRPTA